MEEQSTKFIRLQQEIDDELVVGDVEVNIGDDGATKAPADESAEDWVWTDPDDGGIDGWEIDERLPEPVPIENGGAEVAEDIMIEPGYGGYYCDPYYEYCGPSRTPYENY